MQSWLTHRECDFVTELHHSLPELSCHGNSAPRGSRPLQLDGKAEMRMADRITGRKMGQIQWPLCKSSGSNLLKIHTALRGTKAFQKDSCFGHSPLHRRKWFVKGVWDDSLHPRVKWEGQWLFGLFQRRRCLKCNRRGSLKSFSSHATESFFSSSLSWCYTEPERIHWLYNLWGLI